MKGNLQKIMKIGMKTRVKLCCWLLAAFLLPVIFLFPGIAGAVDMEVSAVPVAFGDTPVAAPGHVGQAYPLRPFYPAARTIDTAGLEQSYFESIIIDVRSRFEYEVVRINKAKHVPLGEGDFIAEIKRYRAPVSKIPLIFYCNDPACSRAFRAALLAQAAGYENVHVYDSGVFSLLMAAPEKVSLMGTTPAQPDMVIPDDYYEKVQIDFEEFVKRTSRIGTLIIDIRDIYHRDFEPNLEGVRNIPMESFLKAVTNRIWAEKKLLIFDQNGEQTRWLQYFLQANGYTDYAFLRGGMQGLDLGSQARKVVRASSDISLNQERLLEVTLDNGLEPLDIAAINLIAGSVGFENHAVIEWDQALDVLGCTTEQLRVSAERLRNGGYLLFSQGRETLVFHMDPRLAWKGKMSGDLWTSRVREFEGSVRK